MELQQLHSSPRVHAQYLKALAKLSEQLNETWKQVFPPDARWPRETCEAFFAPFDQFAVALYDAYAQELLNSTPSREHYLQALNFDLKTLVCNQIYPYREKPIGTLQDALDADARGELADEWTVRMGEAWRQFEHPRHSAAHDRVCREFIDVYGHRPDLWSRLIDRIHTAISRRVVHWLAVHAERVAALAEAATILSPTTREAAARPGEHPIQKVAKRAIRIRHPSGPEIDKSASKAFAVDRNRILAEFETKLNQLPCQVGRTGNSGSYLPALIKWGAERMRELILAWADAHVKAFTSYGVPCDAQEDTDLKAFALETTAGSISRIHGHLRLRSKRLRTAEEGSGMPWHLEIESAMGAVLDEGLLKLDRQRIKFRDSERARDPIDLPPRKALTNIGQLMSRIGQPLTPEWSAAFESALSTYADSEAMARKPTLTRMLRMGGRMGVSEFRSQLPLLLQELGLEMPVGLLQPPRGRGGRPPSKATSDIHARWVKMGKPKITAPVCDRIANDFFPKELKGITRGSAQYRKARERVRQAIQRCEKRAAT